MYGLESLDRNNEDKKLMGYFYEYQIQKVDQFEHRISSIIQRKNGKSLVRWKGFNPILPGIWKDVVTWGGHYGPP